MLTDFMLKPFEWALNKVCTADECFMPRLVAYQGKIIRFCARGGGLTCDCEIGPDSLMLHTARNTLPDITLELTPRFVWHWLQAPQNPLVFFDNAYSISGDMELADALKAVFATLEVDVEEQLAEVVGDAVAVNVCHGVSRVRAASAAAREQVVEDVRDYLQQEKEWLVSDDEINDFIRHTHTLRDDVSRCEARIARLTQYKENQCDD